MHIARSMYDLFFNAYLVSNNNLPASTGFARLDGEPEQAAMKVVPSKQTNRLKRKNVFSSQKSHAWPLSMAYFGKNCSHYSCQGPLELCSAVLNLTL